MKVIHRSDSPLMIEDRPWFIEIMMIGMALVFLSGSMALVRSSEIFGGAMMGTVGVGAPLLIGALMVKRVRVTLNRDEGRRSRVSRSVRGLTREDFALDRLVQARVGVSTDSDGTTYRMELRLKDPEQTVPFTACYTSGGRPAEMARAVNDWLADRQAATMPTKADANR